MQLAAITLIIAVAMPLAAITLITAVRAPLAAIASIITAIAPRDRGMAPLAVIIDLLWPLRALCQDLRHRHLLLLRQQQVTEAALMPLPARNAREAATATSLVLDALVDFHTFNVAMPAEMARPHANSIPRPMEFCWNLIQIWHRHARHGHRRRGGHGRRRGGRARG